MPNEKNKKDPSPITHRAEALGLAHAEHMSGEELCEAISRREAVIDSLDPQPLRKILEWAGEPLPPETSDPEPLALAVYALELDHFE